MEPLLTKDNYLFLPNSGLLDESLRPIEEIEGESLLGGELKAINNIADWRPFLPVHEQQYSDIFDTYACTNFAATNQAEILGIYKYGKEYNYSDRFNSKMSGTTYKVGNYASGALSSLTQKHGIVTEDQWAWDKKIMTPEQYYSEIPQNIKDEALKWFDMWEASWGWHEATPYVHKKALREALTYSPVGVSIPSASVRDADGVYHTDKTVFGHRVVALYVHPDGKVDILDHYMQVRTLSADFPLSFSSIMTLELKNPFEQYRGKLIKNTTSPKVFWVGTVTGKLIWIENPAKFEFGRDEKIWGGWNEIIDVSEPIEEYITF
jgi:hypothetical protein